MKLPYETKATLFLPANKHLQTEDSKLSLSAAAGEAVVEFG